ncbi:DUF6612 family protein [Actinomadura rudentiformis]|uniref:LppX_LprAFG lipoprotein n=1 Tax=Actinomadura rudentiformis TaxID=359158 RepID=A0A6H9YRR5_9ACTN|nr:DUF6612 family protein [Actinomadura rudentiformis]KAB2350656.1 LppX_LprAFG lipoprotein [Actinomadura rudentiformis]
MIRRFAAGTAVATGLALSLTGCLGGAKDKAGETGNQIQLSAAQVLGKAAEKTGQTDTFKADVTIDGTMSQGSMKMHMVMQARIRPTLAMAINIDSANMGGQSMPGGGMEMRLVSDAMYMKIPGLAAQNGGKPWSRMPLSALGGNYDQLLQQAQQQNPAEQTKLLTGSKDVREVGTENVGGVQTKHYSGTVSLDEALGKLDPQSRQKMEKAYQQLGTQKIGFDVWVSDDSLPRKIISKVQTGMGAVNTTMLFSDYGKPVEVSAPPASETGEFKMPNLGGN